MNSGARTDYQLPKRYAVAIIFAWTILLIGSAAWNFIYIEQTIVGFARIEAQVTMERDIVYRRWNSEHGGVYVPATEQTPPNPYLAGIPERDLVTASDKLLTLVNPAYMTRQVYQLAEHDTTTRGHLTSLNPVRPENAPDTWEADALGRFEQKEPEVSALLRIDDEEYMRLMRPFFVEPGCLKCHAAQGYKLGDIRGGISVSVPMSLFSNIKGEQQRAILLAHALLWTIGLLGIVFGFVQFEKNQRERSRAEDRLRYQSSHDVLTGLYNRAFFEEIINTRTEQQFPVSLILADVDGLKRVNDTQGHAAGDDLLRRAAGVLRSSFRTEDVVARIGGDEFAVVLSRTDPAAAGEAVQRIRAHLAQQNSAVAPAFSISLGAAVAATSQQILDALRQADEQMYLDKKTHQLGRGEIVTAVPQANN